MERFYVYAWMREDGTPFYVGKGTGRRAWTQNCHIQRVPPPGRVKILKDGLTDEDAREWEVDLISLLGRKDLGTGCLRNLTNGGEGISGYRFSDQSRAKMSAAHKGRRRGPQTEQHKTRKAKAQMRAVTWSHEEHGTYYCSAVELVSRFGSLSRAGLSRIKTGAYGEYKGWRVV